jgi:hypothetical protein
VAEIMAQGCGPQGWSRWMHGTPHQKPALLPGFWSLFFDFETKLCFWSQGLEANRFFTVGAGKRCDSEIYPILISASSCYLIIFCNAEIIASII